MYATGQLMLIGYIEGSTATVCHATSLHFLEKSAARRIRRRLLYRVDLKKESSPAIFKQILCK